MNISELAFLITFKFIQELYQEDEAEAALVKAAGCPHCGGVLHVSNYPRKARGLGSEFAEMSWRISFCCALCRRRISPKSVRFLGRKVYSAVSLVIAGVLRGQGVKVAKTCGLIGMSAETQRRWNLWWSVLVQSSSWWSAARAQIMPPLEGKHFVGELFGRLFVQAKSVKTAIQKLLIFVSPLTVPAQYPSWSVSHDKNTQRMSAAFVAILQ
jgi:hypothetical protein